MRNDPVADRGLFGAVEPPDIGGVPTVDGYTIERELGRGGEAIVYLARERGEGRRVAIKVLRPDLVASLQTERFLQEIEIISDLVHPNILPLLRSGRSSGLLYYVSPYVDGESLRAYLKREVQLRIVDAIRIIREVAYALDYACRRGVVHRDIKPENILLADHHAIVADFGVARALSIAGDQRLTAKGLAVGTPAYMSPEQASAEARIDGRSDTYSLGCVLYELLSGSPPFHGITPQQILAQHLASPVPPLRHVRSTVSPELEAVVLKALEKLPADRYATAAEFADALAGLEVPIPPRVWRRRVAAVLATGLVGGAIWAQSQVDKSERSNSATSGEPDTNRYAVLGLDGGSTITIGDVSVEQMMRDALKRWRDFQVADQVQVRSALGTRPTPLSATDARSVATDVNAGRLIRLQVSPTADSVRVDAALIDTRSGAVLIDSAIRVPRDRGAAEPGIARLTSHLLLHGAVAPRRAGSEVRSRSLRAQQAYLRGHAALDEWNLPAAESEFRVASVADPRFTEAFLWLAQVLLWTRTPTARWQDAAEDAGRTREHLALADSLRLRALLAAAKGSGDPACGMWSRLVDLDQNEFTARYALGQCLANDSAVVRDIRSPTGWRFRASYQRALDAYQKAFRLQPAIHRSFRGGSSEDIRRLLMTNSNQVRFGRALPPDTLSFNAYPSWSADSLAFIPIPAGEFGSAHRWVSSEDVNTAVRKQRELFHDIATRWRVAFPRSPDALEAVAVALDLLGNRSALIALDTARQRAVEPDDRMRMAALEVWMRVKLSAPRNVQGLRDARTLADSLLRAHTSPAPAEAKLLAGLAALTGRASQAAHFNRLSEANVVPAAIAQVSPALVAHAALGGPTDTIHSLEREMDRAIRTTLTDPARNAARATLARAALLALPEHRFDSTPPVAGGSSGKLLLAWYARDLSQARRVVEGIRTDRQAGLVRAPDVTTDLLYAEAAVLASLGDPRAAADWLDPTLDSLVLVAPQTLANVERAGTLVRAMVLRATIAAALNDRPAARTWARAVIELWSKPDPFLTPTLDRMRQLAR